MLEKKKIVLLKKKNINPHPKNAEQESLPKIDSRPFRKIIEKRLKELRPWTEKEHISSYRIYNADLSEFQAAIDLYENKWLHIQEYAPPKKIDPLLSAARLQAMIDISCDFLSIQPENCFVKTRQKHGRFSQYTKIDKKQEFYEIREGGLKFLCNFSDYLDVGIFLDHRRIRDLFRQLAFGKKVCNLFAYTCSASLYAVDGKAFKAVSVDTSNTYLDWGKGNARLNQQDLKRHEFIKADSLTFLEQNKEKFDLMLIDPPTFSNNKSAGRIFDVQKDHPALLSLAFRNLKKEGQIIFSNNFRGFSMDKEICRKYTVQEISSQTRCPDFNRKNSGHRAWILSP